MAQPIIDDVAAEIHLACVFRPEITPLEINHHEVAQLEVTEKKMNIEILATEIEVVMERLQVSHQRCLQLPLLKAVGYETISSG